MALSVVCKNCQARIPLNDGLLRDKEPGRVVTVRCHDCHATLEVDVSKAALLTDLRDEKPATPPAPQAPRKPLTAKPAPRPPRPTKSATLMGIGTPARPAEARELVALSPGFLDLGSGAARQRTDGAFPERARAPAPVEEVSSGDWEINEGAAGASGGAVPESVDDFVEALPPSLPPRDDEEVPSSTGTPSLKQLTHHDEQAKAPRYTDFLAHLTATVNGGLVAGATGEAPTIDVSALADPAAEAALAPSIDVSDFDVPLAGSDTLPLFQLGVVDTAPPAAAPTAVSPHALVGTLNLAGFDGAERSPAEPDPGSGASVRERKYVIAPSASNIQPAASQEQRPSGLALPVLLALATAAGVLIWQRSSPVSSAGAVQLEPATADAPAAKQAAAPAVLPAAPTTGVAPAAAPTDDVTFETAPTTPKPKAAGPTPAAPRDQPTPPPETTPSAPTISKALAAPAAPTTVAPAPSPPAAPTAEAQAQAQAQAPAAAADPAGPFDRAAAAAALNAGATRASACKKEGDPSGIASVVITFAPSGRVTSANISGPPFAGTAIGGCIAGALRKARVPAFDGDRVTVSKTIVVQ